MEIPMITISQYNDIVADKEKCFLIFTKQKCSVCARLMPNMQKIADEYASHPEMHFYNMEIHDPDARSLFKSWNLGRRATDLHHQRRGISGSAARRAGS